MKGYGQFCPVAKASEIVGERWTPLVLRELLCGSRRFNDLRRGVPLMSPSLLAQRLRTLEQVGIVRREHCARAKVWEYHLTAAGEELGPLIEMLGVWGSRWVRSRFGRQDLDPGLLMWDIRRRFDPGHLPARRITIQFEFTDTPAKFRHWWLIIDAGVVDLCLTDPGFEVDLIAASTVRELTRFWLGEIGFDRAVRSGALRLSGPRDLKRALKDCLQLSLVAGIPAADPATAGLSPSSR